ncbi:MAG: cytochrome c [Sulfuricaulis sp.]|nr:cytochrome c [Sulfuricaulis sp.]
MMPARVAVFLGLIVAAVPAAAVDNAMRHGEYLFRAAGCVTCHTDEKHQGAPLAGGRALTTRFGTFYTPNITPDPETGIGRWSEADFVRALREGKSPAGEPYYPAFPYTSYTRLTDADIRAIKTYLFSQKPVRRVNQPHKLPWYLRSRQTLNIWKTLFFKSGVFQPQPEQSPKWNRGAYLVTAVAHCGECHTPRHLLGGYKESLRFAGAAAGVDGDAVPNITPDKKTGIGQWRQSDLVDYLETGATPDGDYAGGAMAEVIDNNLTQLTKDDRQAIAVYIMSLPPVTAVAHKNDRDKKGLKKSRNQAN